MLQNLCRDARNTDYPPSISKCLQFRYFIKINKIGYNVLQEEVVCYEYTCSGVKCTNKCDHIPSSNTEISQSRRKSLRFYRFSPDTHGLVPSSFFSGLVLLHWVGLTTHLSTDTGVLPEEGAPGAGKQIICCKNMSAPYQDVD